MPLDHFLVFYRARQQDRRDGYGPGLFSGLTTDELAEARALLLARGLKGDTIDLNALVHVGDAAVVDALLRAQASDTALGHLFSIERLQTLFRLTGEPRHLEGLFRWIDGKDADARCLAAQALSLHVLPGEFAGPLVQRLASGRHEDIALPLVSGWLATQGERTNDMAVFNKNLSFIRRVMAARPSRRAALLNSWAADAAGIRDRR